MFLQIHKFEFHFTGFQVFFVVIVIFFLFLCDLLKRYNYNCSNSSFKVICFAIEIAQLDVSRCKLNIDIQFKLCFKTLSDLFAESIGALLYTVLYLSKKPK